MREDKWIVKKADYLLHGFTVYLYECPKCHATWKERFNFCPDCGYDARGIRAKYAEILKTQPIEVTEMQYLNEKSVYDIKNLNEEQFEAISYAIKQLQSEVEKSYKECKENEK